MTGLPLLDWEPARQSHSATSCDAAERIKPAAGTLRELVLEHIASKGERGATDEEGSEATGIKEGTYRARRVGLMQAGLIHDSGALRKTRSGRLAVAWRASP